METLERPMQRIEANSAKIKALSSEVEALLSEPRPRSTGIPWAALALGAVMGAAIVAIAGWGL